MLELIFKLYLHHFTQCSFHFVLTFFQVFFYVQAIFFAFVLVQFFFCLQAAQEGGQTPIVDGRLMFKGLRPDLRERLREKQLMYVRNFVPAVDVSWQDFFRTSGKAEVEALSKLPSLDGIRAQLLSLLSTPASQFVRLLDAKRQKDEPAA